MLWWQLITCTNQGIVEVLPLRGLSPLTRNFLIFERFNRERLS